MIKNLHERILRNEHKEHHHSIIPKSCTFNYLSIPF